MRSSGLVFLSFMLGAVLVTGASTNTAFAQDMSFDLADDAGASEAPAEGPPSEQFANGLRLYQQGNYADAAVVFQQVVDGETTDGEGNKQKAAFFLAKSFYHLRFYQSALTIFDEITNMGIGHNYFDETLQWLSQLAAQLPEAAGIVEMVGRYGVPQLEEFNTPETQDLYLQMQYLMGRHLYAQGEWDLAIELFENIPTTSEYYPPAKFFQGITFIRMRRASPAIQSFRAILTAIEEGDLDLDSEEEDRYRDLAWISLARVYYTAANRTDAETGDREVDGRLLGQAVEAWTQVDEASEYWLPALFESSWAFFLADEYSRALGNVHTLYSPYFPDAYYPEALVLKAVTFFVNCQIDNARAMIKLFHDRYDPVREQLTITLANMESNEQFFEFLGRVRTGQASQEELPPNVRGIVRSAMDDRTLLGHVEYVRLLDLEKERLGEMPEAFQQASVGGRIDGDIAMARTFGVDRTGDLAMGRYRRLIRELEDLTNQVDTVELEVFTYMRGQIDQEMQQQLTDVQRTGGGDVAVDEEHQLWPFDGEYWRDELGFYRQQVTNQCGR